MCGIHFLMTIIIVSLFFLGLALESNTLEFSGENRKNAGARYFNQDGCRCA